MAYGEKYFGEFGDFYGRLVKVSILERNYAGASTEMLLQGANLEYNGSDNDLLVPVITSSLVIRVISTTNFQYIDLYSADAKKFRVIVTVDSVELWRGYIVPDMFNEPYTAAPYVSQIVATDGLKILDTEEFTMTGVKSQYQIIEHCIGKIYPDNLQTSFNEALDIFEENHDINVSPILQTFVDCKRYEGKNCFEVLSDIMKLYASRIYMKNGRFWIVPYRGMKKEVTYRKHEFLGVTTDTFDPEKLVSYSRDSRMANVDQQLNILPGWKYFDTRIDLLKKESFLLNSDFAEWGKTGTPGRTRWTYPNDWSGTALIRKATITDKYAVAFRGNSSTPVNSIFQHVPGTWQSGDRGAKFEVSFAVQQDRVAPTTIAQFWMQIKITDHSTNTKWLNAFGAWEDTQVFINIENIEQQKTPSLETITIISDPIPIDGNFVVDVYESDKGNLILSEIKGTVVNIDGDIYPDDFEYRKNINLLNNYIGEDVELMTADFPDFGNVDTTNPTTDVGNEQHEYWGGLFLNTSKTAVTRLWQTKERIDNDGGLFNNTDQLHKIVAGEKMQLSIPQWAITGTIQSSEMGPDSAIVDYGISPKKYLFCNGVFDLKMCMINGTWIENGTYSGAPWILEDGTWNDDGIWIDESVWND